MRTVRHYVDLPLAVDALLTLPEAAVAHLVRVLRLKAGDECVLFNGDGFDYAARMVSIGKKSAQAQVVARRAVDNESPGDFIVDTYPPCVRSEGAP